MTKHDWEYNHKTAAADLRLIAMARRRNWEVPEETIEEIKKLIGYMVGEPKVPFKYRLAAIKFALDSEKVAMDRENHDRKIERDSAGKSDEQSVDNMTREQLVEEWKKLMSAVDESR